MMPVQWLSSSFPINGSLMAVNKVSPVLTMLTKVAMIAAENQTFLDVIRDLNFFKVNVLLSLWLFCLCDLTHKK